MFGKEESYEKNSEVNERAAVLQKLPNLLVSFYY
jgi:hypothetical protein